MQTLTTKFPVTETNRPHGSFVYSELYTPDMDAAEAFYSDLFGWTINADNSSDTGAPDMRFAMVDDHLKAGMMQLTEEMALHMPPSWMVYFMVDDLASALDRVRDGGGAVTLGPIEAGTAGKLAVVTDPAGATFALFEDAPGRTTRSANGEHGTPLWAELHSNDCDGVLGFYEQLLGWTRESRSMGDFTYHVMHRTAQPGESDAQTGVGGIMQRHEMEGEGPSYWSTYFLVGDVDERADHASDIGASIIMPPMDVPGAGRSSSLLDPQGAAFQILDPQPPSEA